MYSYVRGRVRMIPYEFETSLTSLLGRCRVRDVVVVFVCRGRVRMIPFELVTSLPSLLGHCRVRDVAVVFVCSWSSSYDPF